MKDGAHRDKEVVHQTPKSKGTQQERVQKVGGDLDKDAITKKLKKAKLSQPQAMKYYEHGDKVVQQKPGSNHHPSSSKNQPLSGKNRVEDSREPVVNEEEENTNRDEEQGISQRKTRGRTLCKKIHARTFEERVEVTYNDVDQPIGPTKKVVSDLSLFLVTLARNSTFCPLKYTNWLGIPEKNKNRVWRYANVCGCICEFECIIIIVFNLLILCSLILFF
ncbi:uncharacterized protein [Medicago truncatula]|uniref:uncharacterized protein n=1 Tax=Medicago truncatula TaxID=3880 RepID=UPI0000D5D0BD|nr:uncharacterized protein LOC112421089 [Medicago truncatula]